jgi:carbonic anhydrase
MPITNVYISKRAGVEARFEGISYYLEDFRFLAPAEHKIDGETFAMEMQMTHRSIGDLATARFFKVLLLFRVGPVCNPVLAKLNWVKLPRNKGETRAIPDGFRLADMFPHDLDYFSYDGSLSRPPCSEGVAQVVLRQPLELCARQLEEYQFATPKPNARPVQPLHGREVSAGSFRPEDGLTDSFWSWGYAFDNDGTKWGRYYPACRGQEQSPIVILTDDVDDRGTNPANKRLSFDWAPRCRVAVQNTGRSLTIQIYAGFTKWEGVEWRVIKVEFHAGSEHQVNDKQFPMEMQIVHTNSEGGFMILSVLYELGTQNRFLQSLGWDNLPGPPLASTDRRQGTKTKEEDALEALSSQVFHAQVRLPPAETESVLSIHVRENPIDLLSAMPPDRAYWTYRGSLTKPPCTEGVTWVVLEQRARLSLEQVRCGLPTVVTVLPQCMC